MSDRLPLNNDLENPAKVRAETEVFLQGHPSLLAELRDHLEAFRHLMDLIPETLGKFFSGHIFPYVESRVEIENSVHLAFLGFYKSALVSLRACLELGLLYVYYDRNDDSEKIIKAWLHSQEPTPFKKQIIAGLSRIPNVSALNARWPLVRDIETVYSELCNYVHTAGASYSSTHLNTANTNRFVDASFRLWLQSLKSVVVLLSMLFLMKYPVGLQDTPVDDKFGLNGPVGTFLNPYQVHQIKRILPPVAVASMQEISDADPAAHAMADYINGLPDITDAEMEAQALEIDKEGIRHQGYLLWYENNVAHTGSPAPELEEWHRSRLKRLEDWAKQNDLYR